MLKEVLIASGNLDQGFAETAAKNPPSSVPKLPPGCALGSRISHSSLSYQFARTQLRPSCWGEVFAVLNFGHSLNFLFAIRCSNPQTSGALAICCLQVSFVGVVDELVTIGLLSVRSTETELARLCTWGRANAYFQTWVPFIKLIILSQVG